MDSAVSIWFGRSDFVAELFLRPAPAQPSAQGEGWRSYFPGPEDARRDDYGKAGFDTAPRRPAPIRWIPAS